jgi:subtilisin family serine protease
VISDTLSRPRRTSLSSSHLEVPRTPSLRTLVHVAVAVATISAAVPAYAQPTAIVDAGAQYQTYADQELLDLLISEYAKDPISFKRALEYITLHRPSIKAGYLRATAARLDSAGLTNGQMFGLIGAAGAVALAIGQMGSGGKPAPGNASSPPTSHDNTLPLVGGGAQSFRTQEYRLNYSLEQIGAAERYAAGLQGQGVKISILDTGIDYDHVEFAGKIDAWSSYSYFNGTSKYGDSNGHGTHVAGILAAAKNDLGTHGVAFGSELLILKGISGGDAERSNQDFIWADAINRSVAAGASIMNNSWTFVSKQAEGNSASIPITDFHTRQELVDFLGTPTILAFDIAVAGDLLTVTAAGNDGANEVGVNSGVVAVLPEYDGYFISAIATDETGRIASYSNRCGIAMNFCLAAPGSNIVSTRDGGGVVAHSGTSMSAPHIAGAAAILKSQNPELTAPRISQILFDTATDLGDAGVDAVYGHGLLNLADARAPQGTLMIYEGSSTDGATTSLSKTGIVASSAMGPALAAALSEQRLMVGDRYDRGYFLSAEKIVGSANAAVPRLAFQTRSQIDDRLAFINSSTGRGIAYEDESVSYYFAQGQITENGIRGATSPLAFMLSDFSSEYTVTFADGISLSGGFSTATGDVSHLGTSVGIEADWDNGQVGLKLGTVGEIGSVLGTHFLGAAGSSTAARTSYLELNARLDITADTSISLSGTRSATDFSQSGLIAGGRDLAGSSGNITLSRDGLMGIAGTFAASISSPLQVTSGEVSVDLPQSRQLPSGGIASAGVGRKNSSISIEAPDRPFDISISYQSHVADDNLGVMLNLGYRAQGGGSHPFIAFAVSRKF